MPNEIESFFEDVDLMNIESIYFNDCVVATSANDVLIVLSKNGKPMLALNTSHISAKLLASKLDQAITSFERFSNQKVPDFEGIRKALGEGNEKSNDS
jgi:hypothetical protein